MSLKGKLLICTESWSKDELDKVIELALLMKKDRLNPRWRRSLDGKTFVMLFHNQSLRTHLSFETAVYELGGHSIYRAPHMGWIKKPTEQGSSGEHIKDAIRVISRYAHGIGIRVILDAVQHYGEGHKILQEYAKWSNIPVISMADDRFHPCQGLADIMTWSNWFNQFEPRRVPDALNGKNLLLTWGKSGLTRPWSSVQSHLSLASRYGMNITLAYPNGYDLDPAVVEKAKYYCEQNQKSFRITHDPDAGYEHANVVFVRNWISKEAYSSGKLNYEDEIAKALALNKWTVTNNKMARTNNAIFCNPMPVDRGLEADDSVIDSAQSLIYEVAENRLHIQKALMHLLMGEDLE
jgi:ornithine carbamoyltransferase